MTLAVYTHADCLEHSNAPAHPESPARLNTILNALRTSAFSDKVQILDAPEADDETLLLAHSRHYLERIKESLPPSGHIFLDADTALAPGSLRAARRAAGAGCAAVKAAMAGTYRFAFCAVRPPGHHALRDRAMGFCIFNNIAVAALFALHRQGLKRVAIVDFDVHHGNGTQAIVEADPGILYVSTHESPLYPGTGLMHENRPGHILNLPLPHGTGGQAYRKVFSQSVLPALKAFAPELLLISAGFDAHRDDPLAGLRLDESDYGWIGGELADFAAEHCEGRAISFLEGGYHLEALAASTIAYLGAYA